MKNLKVFAVAAMMLAALVSCKKNDSPAEPEPKPPVELDNAIEYNGTVTEIKSRFVDMETGVIYLVSREGVTSAGQLDGVNDEYVSILPGDDVESDTNVYEMDFAAADSTISTSGRISPTTRSTGGPRCWTPRAKRRERPGSGKSSGSANGGGTTRGRSPTAWPS